MSTNLKALIAKLNPTSRRAMEFAANLALTRTHYEVDIEHMLLALLDQSDTDVMVMLQAYGIEPSRLQKELLDGLGQFKTGNTRSPVLARNILSWLEAAWLRASVNYGGLRLRSGYLLLELVANRELQRMMGQSSQLLSRIPVDELEDKLTQILRLSKELADDAGNPPHEGDNAEGNTLHPAQTPTPALDRYTVDLTAQARAGKLDPVLGRDAEVRQMMDILLRRRQNNPILTGEPGVGKTAVVEGLAQSIAQGDVPDVLKNVALRTLDLGLLQAGASVKGEFESRLRSVISEVKASPVPIILFIDEAHTIIGAGGQAGQNDAANLLKPALARGELRTIAATTWAEYKKYFEKDAALARRFQVVKVEEPSEDDAIQMLRGVAATMEAHHKVRILDEAVVEAVRISSRYLMGRQLPDKSISVLDTACARVALSRAGLPPALADVQRLIENVDREIDALRKENNPDHASRLEELHVRRTGFETDLAVLREAFDAQRTLVDEISSLREQLKKLSPDMPHAVPQSEPASVETDDVATLRAALEYARARLQVLHRDHLMVYDCVDGSAVADVVSAWTGIPLGRIVSDELNMVRKLKELLENRVVGQTHALDAIARRIQIAKAGLEDPGKPKGVFLLAGPSGVGKTETALALAEILYGGERNLVTINMSEYQEAHSVAGLKGAPPGYVGFGEGGILTEAVRRKPYSVVLLDEVEKAHPDVLELFFQVFDKGVLEDSEGREVDFRNTIIILTSNTGTELINKAVEHGVTVDGKKRHPLPADLADLMRDELQRVFKPAFLGRLNVIPYYPLTEDAMRRVVELKLAKVKRRLLENHGATLEFDSATVKAIVSRCTEIDSGARDADNIIANTVLSPISDELLARMAEEKPVRTVGLKVKRDKMTVVVD